MIIIIIYHYIPSYSTTRYCSSSNSTIFVVDHIIRCDYSCDWVLGEPGPRKLDWLPWEPFEYWHSDGERLLDPIAGWAHTSQPSSGGSVTCQRLEANPPTEAGNSVEYLTQMLFTYSHSLTQPRAFPAEFDSRSWGQNTRIVGESLGRSGQAEESVAWTWRICGHVAAHGKWLLI